MGNARVLITRLALPGWAFFAYKALDFLGNVDFAAGKREPVMEVAWGVLNSPISVGIAFAWLFAISFGWPQRAWAHFHPRPSGVQPIEQSPASLPSAEHLLPFWLRSTVLQVHLAGLWELETHIHLRVLVENKTPWKVLVNGLAAGQGRKIVIGTTSCNDDPEFQSGPFVLPPGETKQFLIRQSIRSELAQAMMMEGGTISLAPENARVAVFMGNIGVGVAYPDIPSLFDGKYREIPITPDRFYLMGPVRTADQTKDLMPLGFLFYSPVHWSHTLIIRRD